MRPSPRRGLTAALIGVTLAVTALTTVLTALPAEARGVNLHRGSHGHQVRLLENRLNRLGLLPRSAVDGRYRAATVNSVKRFQRQHHVRVTGRVNRSVWNMVAREVTRR